MVLLSGLLLHNIIPNVFKFDPIWSKIKDKAWKLYTP